MNNRLPSSVRTVLLLALSAWSFTVVAQDVPPDLTAAPEVPTSVTQESAAAPVASQTASAAEQPTPAAKPTAKARKPVRSELVEKHAKVEKESVVEPPAVQVEKTDSSDATDADQDADPPSTSGSSVQEIVSVGHDSTLRAGDKAEAVVSVFGSSTSAGEVSDAVVSILGDTRVTGPVGDAVVAVLGDVYVNSKIGGDAVAVLGDMELGPNADIGGQVVVVGGSLKRAPQAAVAGGVEQVLGGYVGNMDWLRPWFRHCVLLGRPLALQPGLEWAWGLALGFLALYVLFALAFRGAVEQCVHTFETQPGRSLLASLLTALLSPVVMLLLTVTVIGLVLVPFVGLALMCASLFGKAAVLALIGRSLTRPTGIRELSHPAIGVLVGGLIVLGIYLIPVIGFIVYNLLGFLGLGVVVYTLILASRSADRAKPEAAAAAPLGAAPVSSFGAGIAPEAAAAASFAPSAASSGMGSPGVAPGVGTPPPVIDAALTDAATLPRAGFWVRMGALFIDVLLVGVSLSLLHDLGGVWLLLLAAYGAVMWKLKSTTIGGIVFGLKVVRLDGRPIDWPTAVVRALSCFLSLILVGLGFFWILFDDERQAWHDKIAGTVVVRLPKGVPLV